MHLQTRLFLIFSCLLLLMLGGALVGVRFLTRDLSVALDAAALSVGSALVSVLDRRIESAHLTPSGDPERGKRIEHRVVVRTIKPDAAAGALVPADPLNSSVATVDEESLARTHAEHLERISEGGMRTTTTDTRVFKLEPGDALGDLALTGHGTRQIIRVPRTGVSTAMTRFSRQLMIGAVVLLLLGLVLAWGLAHRIARPLRELASAAGKIGGGAFGQTVAVSGDAEVRTTIETFNRMSAQLAELEAERERLRALANLSELGEVGRGLAHSLRNPLNTLGLAVDTLATESDPAAIASLRSRAREQIRRIDEALKGFLALGAGLGSETIDVRVLVEDLLLEASQRADGRISFELQLPEQALPLKVQAQELRAALQALLVNALEASTDGAQVDIQLLADGTERAQLRIGDRGAGLPASVRERLFTAHLSTKPEGAGMGLFLAHRILRERYGGTLELNDREGGGTLALARFGARRDG